MEKSIWKFHLSSTDVQDIKMPKGAEILCINVQGFIPNIWALVDPNAEKEFRTFEIFGTGHPVEDVTYKRKYVGTYQLQNGSLVFHCFEVIN